MADYKVSDTNLSAIADAIRTKGGTSSGMSFPNGFVNAIGNIPTGEQPTLITKSISANGTYSASSDNADGYSSVTVSVDPKYVSGTFKGDTAGTTISVNVPYTGNGYPVVIIIYPTGGSSNSDTTFYTTVQRYAECMFTAVKMNTGSTPNYASHSATENNYVVLSRYKNSDSDATSYASGQSGAGVVSDYAASATSSACCRFNSKTSMSVYIASTSYGFMKDVEYTYHIVYSA